MKGIMEMSNISDKFKYLFFEHADNEFIIDTTNNNKIYTYGEFFNIVLNFSEFLLNKGVSKGISICYVAENSALTLALEIATLILNAKIALIDPMKGEEEISNIISRVNPKLILRLEDLKNISIKNIKPNKAVFEEINYSVPYLITFTSGSTAEAKGVVNSFENLYLSAMEFGNEFNLCSKNTFYHNFPMAYMAGVLNTFIKPLFFECKIVVAQRLSFMTALGFWGEIQKYNVDCFWINPTYVATLLKLDRDVKNSQYTKNHNITIFCGTAALDSSLKQKFEEKYGTKLYESYGLSETLFISTNVPGRDIKNSVGKILKSVDINLSNENEIQIKTPWMFLGYIGKEPVLKENYFRTGDIGKIKDGNLYITGRLSDIIIKGGVNISPKRISEFVGRYVDEFAILGLRDKFLGEKIACFYAGELNTKNINSNIIKNLGKDYSIDEFYQLKELPKNINGKIDKMKLKLEYTK